MLDSREGSFTSPGKLSMNIDGQVIGNIPQIARNANVVLAQRGHMEEHSCGQAENYLWISQGHLQTASRLQILELGAFVLFPTWEPKE